MDTFPFLFFDFVPLTNLNRKEFEFVMYRNGSFVGLDWKKVDTEHGKQWEQVKRYLGFENWNPLVSSGNAPAVSETRLDLLAKECVGQCRELLFSLFPIECLPHKNPPHNDCPDFSQDIRNLMEQNLTQALCDHLVVTFAYRFFVENLKPKSLYQYGGVITRIFLGTENVKDRVDNDEIKDKTKNFYNNFKRKYRAFLGELGVLGNDTSEGNSILERLKDEVYDLNAASSYEIILKSELTPNTLPPPSAWFLTFFVSRRIKFHNAFWDESDRFFALADLISGPGADRDYQLLLPVETVEEKPCFLAPTLYSTFVGIPVDSATPINQGIPDTEYRFKNSKTKVTISARLQQIFNIYLFERNFHLYAIAQAESSIRKLCVPSNMILPDLHAALLPFRVHAPLVQAQFLAFVSTASDILKKPLLLEQYIKRWNRFALPVMEELFIWGVWQAAREDTDVAALIQEWIAPDSTYERLKTIRLIPAKAKSEIIVPKETASSVINREQLCSFHNGIANAAFRVSDNFDSVF